ncbi:MAG: TlyA family RNA methyltransferase [Bacillota bacterium]|nr:TlyA family RNA methyltransferase [Bacillota bacterium]
MRLDAYMVENGLASGRDRAKELIKNGMVTVNGKPAQKPSIEVDGTVVLNGAQEYVGRGAQKLKKALEVFPVSPEGKICLDVGASTGGFTDCMLKNGAKTVYAVDVGSGQLDAGLASNPKVINMEKTDIRNAKLPQKPTFFSVDVSFISLTLVLKPVYELLAEGSEGVCLIKPQFEAGRENVGKKGVVKDKDTHIKVIKKIELFAKECGFSVLGLDFSPIKGQNGNIEYLMCLKKGGESQSIDLKKVVENAWE